MIGRGALTNPYLFRQILEPGLEVTLDLRVEAILRLFHILQDLLEPREALHKIKKIGAWFTKGVPGGHAFRHNLHACDDAEALLAAIQALRRQSGA
jgi:tRNA-dihydrouridine synthase